MPRGRGCVTLRGARKHRPANEAEHHDHHHRRRPPLAPGRALGRPGRQHRRVLRQRERHGAVPVRRGRPAGALAHAAAGPHAERLARLPARGLARHGLRPACAGPVAAGAGTPFQPEQGPAGPVRAGDRRPVRMARRALRRGPALPAAHGHGRQRRPCAESPRGGGRRLRLGRRRPPLHAPGRHRALRAARQGLHPAPSRCARGLAGHVRGAGQRCGHCPPAAPGHHRGEPAAGAAAHQRAAPARDESQQLLGLQHDRLLLPGPAAGLGRRRPLAARRVPRDGQAAACGGHRGDPRRGLQPHRRGRRGRPDPELARPGQRQLLPPAARLALRLRERHRYG